MPSGKFLQNNYIWVKEKKGWCQEAAPADYKAALEFKTAPAPKELLAEIQTVGEQRNNPQQGETYLQHVATYYANRALPNMHGLQIHGFPVLVSRPRSIKFHLPLSNNDDIEPRLKTRACYATVLYASNHPMLAPFPVTKELRVAAQKPEYHIKTLTLEALADLRNEQFNSVENFIRCLLLKRNERIDELPASEKRKPKKLSLETIYLYAANPFEIADISIRNDIHHLIFLNQSLYGHMGAIFPYLTFDHFNLKDSYAFEDGLVVAKELPGISATDVLEMRQQFLLHRYWAESTAGVGNSYSLLSHEKEEKVSDAQTAKALTTYKQEVSFTTTQKIMQGLVMFAEFSFGKNPRTANCNKSTATFLQACENLDAAKNQRPATQVTGVSKTSFGCNSRMRFWQPVPHHSVNKNQQQSNVFEAKSDNKNAPR